MNRLLYIISLFLGCRLCWIWIDQCGAELGMGETLPFCLECSGLATGIRLILLGISGWLIYKILKRLPEETSILEKDVYPAKTIRIHWQRIILLLGIISYPLWIYWIDKNTFIPGPEAFIITRVSCNYPGVKGTLLWAVEMTFVVLGFKILYSYKES